MCTGFVLKLKRLIHFIEEGLINLIWILKVMLIIIFVSTCTEKVVSLIKASVCNDFNNCKITQILNILSLLMFNMTNHKKFKICAMLSETAIVQFLFGPCLSENVSIISVFSLKSRLSWKFHDINARSGIIHYSGYWETLLLTLLLLYCTQNLLLKMAVPMLACDSI